MIRLADLDPAAVADEVTGWVASQAARLGWSIGDTDAMPRAHGGDVGLSVRVVTHYAQTGQEPGDAPIAGYIQSIVEALYTAAHPDVYSSVEGDWQRRDGDPAWPIDVVIRAALARDAIAHRRPVPLGWLGPLAGLPVATLRTYATRGELRAVDGEVTAAEARRWLSGRGVPGYAK